MTTVLKPRAAAPEMAVLRTLQSRMVLSQKDGKRYMNLEKGWIGEQRFDQLTEGLQNDLYIFNDLCLEHNHSVFQIDTLLITENEILLFEIKNYEGDYIYDSETFRMLPSKSEILNPLHQLNRSVTLMRSLLKKLGILLPVTGYIAFVNPQFTLYQAPLKAPVILPSQLNRFLKELEQSPSLLSRQHRELADRLLGLHLPNSPYARMPQYQFQHLQKGVLCRTCTNFMSKKARKVYCTKCGYEESLESGIVRSAGELALLFPDRQITTSAIYEWCKIIDSRKTIRRVLAQNFRPAGNKRQRYYVMSK